MGGVLSSVLGTNSQYQASPAQAGNPYSQNQLQMEANNQGQIYNQQQALGQQLQAQMAGNGPNPAQQQFQQNVNQNTAQAQGLIASQRGLNPALAAKMGANIGSQNNQQAAAQSGVMQAQQQLAATQNYGNLLGQQQQGNLAQQQLYTGANQGAMNANVNVAQGNQQQAGNLVGGFANAGSAALPALLAAHGGMIPHYDLGGQIQSGSADGPSSSAGQYLALQNPDFSQAGKQMGAAGSNIGKALGTLSTGMGMSQGPTMAGGAMDAGSAGAAGGSSLGMMAAMASKGGVINFKPGGAVPGNASVMGDSAANDTVPAMVSPGEVVLPRSVVNSKNPQKEAAKFLGAVLAKRQK